jgi:6-phosphogluconolactonase
MSAEVPTAPIEVIVHPDESVLAEATAARLITRLIDAQSASGTASVVLTGGGVGVKTLEAVAASPARDAVDWSRVDVYWGDERFVPADSPDRNDAPALSLLGPLGIDPDRAHPMPTSDGPDGSDVDAAAARYAALLAEKADPAHRHVDDVVAFDIALIGIGPDGHCCSLFPDQPGPLETAESVIGVRDSPKPPSERISLTFRALNAADQVWVIASGEGKAAAVARALGGADPTHVPSAGARGHDRTLWLLDRDAASQLPPAL